MRQLTGCGGRLCRLLRWQSRKLEGIRPAEDAFGGADIAHPVLTYHLCGRLTGGVSKSGDGRVDIPGTQGGGYAAHMRLLVIASSAPIEPGDIVYAGEDAYRITGQTAAEPPTYSLEHTDAPND